MKRDHLLFFLITFLLTCCSKNVPTSLDTKSLEEIDKIRSTYRLIEEMISLNDQQQLGNYLDSIAVSASTNRNPLTQELLTIMYIMHNDKALTSDKIHKVKMILQSEEFLDWNIYTRYLMRKLYKDLLTDNNDYQNALCQMLLSLSSFEQLPGIFYTELIRIYREISGIYHYNIKDYAKEDSFACLAIDLSSRYQEEKHTAILYYNRAVSFLEREDYQPAIKNTRKAERLLNRTSTATQKEIWKFCKIPMISLFAALAQTDSIDTYQKQLEEDYKEGRLEDNIYNYARLIIMESQVELGELQKAELLVSQLQQYFSPTCENRYSLSMVYESKANIWSKLGNKREEIKVLADFYNFCVACGKLGPYMREQSIKYLDRLIKLHKMLNDVNGQILWMKEKAAFEERDFLRKKSHELEYANPRDCVFPVSNLQVPSKLKKNKSRMQNIGRFAVIILILCFVIGFYDRIFPVPQRESDHKTRSL